LRARHAVFLGPIHPRRARAGELHGRPAADIYRHAQAIASEQPPRNIVQVDKDGTILEPKRPHDPEWRLVIACRKKRSSGKRIPCEIELQRASDSVRLRRTRRLRSLPLIQKDRRHCEFTVKHIARCVGSFAP